MASKRLRRSDGFRLRGNLEIITRDAVTGEIVDTWAKHNVITFGGTDILVYLLAPNVALGATVQEESQIKSMRFGTSNQAAQRTDTDLIAEAIVGGNPVRYQFQDADRVIGASGTVEFHATLGAGDSNGVTLREAGLFTRGTNDDPLLAAGSTLCARQVYPDIAKTALISVEFVWRLTFTV